MADCKSAQVLIKNLPYEITENEIFEWCSGFGPVLECSLKYDRYGYSRGFAFVTFQTMEGHNNMLSNGPYTCQNRSLTVKSTNQHAHLPFDSTSQTVLSPTENENSSPTGNDMPTDDDDSRELIELREELDTNIECIQIGLERERKYLEYKLENERRLLKESEEAYKIAECDYQKEEARNIQLRYTLAKTCLQAFNLRREISRRIKQDINQGIQSKQGNIHEKLIPKGQQA